ncbi:unnamed protein product [Diamesa serratosioi]
MKCILILLVFKALIVFGQHDMNLKLYKEWNRLVFWFPSRQVQKDAIDQGQYVPNSPFPLDVDVDHHTRVFITIPRFSEGVPVTLGIVDPDESIYPYPDYSWHSSHGKNCDHITSALRIAIDECRRLWVIDSGKIGSVQHCPPQLLAFNLNTNELISRYKFPKTMYTDLSLFISPLVDVGEPLNSCRNTKVYIPDVNAFALIVYDHETKKSWRIQNILFYPNPNFGTFTIAGESFDLMDGIFGVALQNKNVDADNLIDNFVTQENDNRLMYFHTLSSNTENTVPLSILNNQSLWENNLGAAPRSFKIIGSRSSQTSIQVMDSNGNMWFVLIDPLAIACWDSSTPYNQNNVKIVLKNEKTLQFASGLKLVKNALGKEELWIVTLRIQKIYGGTLNFDETNFRIQTIPIETLLRGQTKCNGVNHKVKMYFPTE